jgi:olefin beta-lactone synthetase
MSDPSSTVRGMNVGSRLSDAAGARPAATAVVMPLGYGPDGKRKYAEMTFRQLDEDSNRIASGLLRRGVPRGARLVLLVRPSIDFVSLVFALLKAGMVAVLIDPGMGRRRLIGCLAECEPDGFVAVPAAQAIRALLRFRFPKARYLVTVGKRWFWGGITLDQLRASGSSEPCAVETDGADPAAIIFTTGSTGPPKGVLYCHENFWGQVDTLRDHFRIAPGEVNLPGFPLFGLFNCAMGVATVLPDMDFTRPADVDPAKILEAVRDWRVTQAFGSPAMWNTVGLYCERRQERVESLRCVFSAGAPVPPHVLRRMLAALPADGEVHTPYGATEALPVSSIASSEILGETAARTETGGGYCVGRRLGDVQWKVIRIRDEPLSAIEQIEELPAGQIGELIVRGSVVTRQYVTRIDANALHKIPDGSSVWHRMGDVGYLDELDRFWFCGRKSHRVQTSERIMFTIPCEAIFNRHPSVYRSALVGIGEPGRQQPVVVVEPWPQHWPNSAAARRRLVQELLAVGAERDHTAAIRHVLLRRRLPVDIRHNAKIFREHLVPWAARRIGG